MKVVFVSNFFNHHQKPFSDAMWKLTNGNYSFIVTEKIPEERKKLGYKEYSDIEYLNSEYLHGNKESVLSEIYDADVVIAGSCPEHLLFKRIKSNKLTFRYSERLFKKTHGIIKNILIACKRILLYKNNSNTYLLCASAFAASDFNRIGKFKNKCYKWGYFPECKKYDNINNIINNKNKFDILWCGRLIDWKHPEDAVYVAKMLKDSGYTFSLNMIGTGDMQNEIANKIKVLGLSDCVHLLGSIPSDKVRAYMEKSSVFLFTSDQSEGWGAVLNEAMNSGCAVIASHEIGSVPFLINNKINGLIYHSECINDLFDKIVYLIDNSEKSKIIGKNAYNTILSEWNSNLAAKRILELSKHILYGEIYPDLYKEGPCSKF